MTALKSTLCEKAVRHQKICITSRLRCNLARRKANTSKVPSMTTPPTPKATKTASSCYPRASWKILIKTPCKCSNTPQLSSLTPSAILTSSCRRWRVASGRILSSSSNVARHVSSCLRRLSRLTRLPALSSMAPRSRTQSCRIEATSWEWSWSTSMPAFGKRWTSSSTRKSSPQSALITTMRTFRPSGALKSWRSW